MTYVAFGDSITYGNDGIHPSQEHHATITAPLICEFIETNYTPEN